jgi:hypothetical protein
VKRTTIAVSVCLSVVPSCAYAVDWSLNSTLSETVEANNNPFLRALAAGTFSSYSTIAANAVASTPTSKFTFDGDINYRKYWGTGIDTPGAQSESLGGSTKLHYENKEKYSTDREYLDAGWHRQSTQFALLGELGVITPTRGFLDTTYAGGGIDRSITSLDTISLSARSNYTSYDPGTGGTPFTDTSGNVTWRHSVNSIAALTASSEVEALHFDNSLNTNVTIVRENAGVEATLSPRLSFRGTAGVAYVQSENGVALFALNPSASGADSSAADFITNMVLTYKMFPDTTMTLTGLQTIAPSIVGSLLKTTSIAAGLSRTVNSHETLSFAASASQTTSSGTTSTFLSASVTYGYQLTREWTAQLSYRYLHRLATAGTASSGFVLDPITGIPLPISSGLGPASSNSILLVVSRSVSILPDGY